MFRHYVNDFLSFVNASPSPYHAVQTSKKLLVAAGFQELSERDNWESKVELGHKYFVTRNGSSIVAFTVGQKWKPGNGISMIGAHTDSPTFKVKPVSKKESCGYQQVGVETYGGGLWHTWFDRDLSVAGRVFVKQRDQFVPKLIKINKPILRIPTLAIHLDRNVNEKLEFNKETNTSPILGLIGKALNSKKEESTQGEEKLSLLKMTQRHHKNFLDLIAQELNVSSEDIQDFELVLYDTQLSAVGGINDEFVYSPRLDNLCSSYCSVAALIESVTENNSLAADDSIRLISLFDHEEIGSTSAQGAQSNFLGAIITRLASLPLGGKSTASSPFETFSKSFMLSSDMAHGVHPNYDSKHESLHRPQLNQGPTIKVNANQRYATNSPGIVLLQNCAEQAKVPLQLFVGRNDTPCGSTIGPFIAANLGVRTLDIGNPQLSMHSCREVCGSDDIEYAVKLYTKFFENFADLEKRILVDGVHD